MSSDLSLLEYLRIVGFEGFGKLSLFEMFAILYLGLQALERIGTSRFSL